MNTIQEIKKFPIGTVVPAVSGTVKATFPRKTGEGQYGPWSVQTLIVGDGAEEMPVSCWGYDDLSHLKGNFVSIGATGKDHRTGKTTGTELKEGKDKQGAARLELHVSAKKGGFIGGDTPNPAHMAGSTTTTGPQTAIPAIPSHFATPSRGIEGVTVGMAVNCAVRLAAANAVNTDDLDAYIYARASSLIKTAQRLQSGDLAP